jgi:HCOMODA/2-hydroxy-3-carboxy-muconic semialdehyde decarboxylase
MSASTADQRLTVNLAMRAMARAGLSGAYGHCSLRLNTDEFLVSAGKAPSTIRLADDGIVVPVQGPLPGNILGEVAAHQAIYRLRPEVGGIVRFISPKVLSLSATGCTPRARHGFGTYFAPAPPMWPHGGLLRTPERANGAAQMLGSASAIVLRGNGAIVVAANLEQALVLAWYLEDAARVEMDVLSSGCEDSPGYTAEEIADRATWSGGIVERMWQHLIAGDADVAAT